MDEEEVINKVKKEMSQEPLYKDSSQPIVIDRRIDS